MARQRSQRVGEEIKREVSEIIRLDAKDPGLTKMTSVTGVEITRDLSFARIFVSVYGSAGEQEEVLKVLGKATGFIRSEIGKRIRLRHVPEIEFMLDRSLEYGAHIEGLLKELGSDSGADNKND